MRPIDRVIGLAWITILAGGFLAWHDWHQYGLTLRVRRI